MRVHDGSKKTNKLVLTNLFSNLKWIHDTKNKRSSDDNMHIVHKMFKVSHMDLKEKRNRGYVQKKKKKKKKKQDRYQDSC
jgi:hypothetical protein